MRERQRETRIGLSAVPSTRRDSNRRTAGDEVKESLELGERTLGYFDGRHARALGRRAMAPVARAVR